MKNDLKALIALVTTYTISNFLLLLNQGLYWDSWVWAPIIKEKNYQLLWNLLSQGKLYTSYFLFRLSGLTDNPIFFLKLFSFISWLIAGLLLYGILRKKIGLPENRSLFISAAFILIPTYLVKAEPSILQYSINNMIFFLAAFIYCAAEKINERVLSGLAYFLSWTLFLLSFLTNSFLVFYGGFLLLLFWSYYQKNLGQPLASPLWPWIKNNFFFIILPIVFWVLKLLFLQPSGSYADYNQFISFNAVSLKFVVGHLWDTIVFGLFWPIIAPITILGRKIFVLLSLIIGAITYLLTKNMLASENEDSRQEKDFNPKYYLMAGGILFFLGFLPYFLVGKSPHIPGNVFAMRHALLLPLGSSLIILGLILFLIKEKWQLRIQVITLTLFMVFNIYNYYWLDMDWYKQISVTENLKETSNKDIVEASGLIFYDQMPNFNWLNRNVHGEEYTGYVQEAFRGSNKKFAIAEGKNMSEEYTGYQQVMPDAYPYSKNFNPQSKVAEVAIVSKAQYELLTVSNWLKLKRRELFSDYPTFLKELKEKLQIEVITKYK